MNKSDSGKYHMGYGRGTVALYDKTVQSDESTAKVP